MEPSRGGSTGAVPAATVVPDGNGSSYAQVELLGVHGGGVTLVSEWNRPPHREEIIDVNRGHTPEAFIRAAFGQVTGRSPDAATVKLWSTRLREDTRLRRVDVIRTLCLENRRECQLSYSNPWQTDPDLPPPDPKTVHRDIGTVMMFFFHCPGGVNCGMDWANNHAYGMETPSPKLTWKDSPAGFYDPGSPGFWRRELKDAGGAGLNFILPNVYGPDMEEGRIRSLAEALSAEPTTVKIGLYDDTWAWGKPFFGASWKEIPDLSDTERAARMLYNAKWKPFFQQISRKDWYLVDGRPLIHFYNAGTLHPREKSAAVLRRMKEMFQEDFKVTPFLAVDHAYFVDPTMPAVADAEFTWDTLRLKEGVSRYTMKGHTLYQAMVRWDSFGRDHPGAIATSTDRIVKGPERLQHVLEDSKSADILVLATWNDLGEGTGINRCYDYYYRGQWLSPDYFLRLIRNSQCCRSSGSR